MFYEEYYCVGTLLHVLKDNRKATLQTVSLNLLKPLVI